MFTLSMTTIVLISLWFAVAHHKLTKMASDVTDVDANYVRPKAWLETPLFVLCVHVANSYMSVSVAHYEEADSAIILRESSGLWRCRLENADNNPLWKMHSRLVCIYKWSGERLRIVWPHLELWSDEATLSSLLDQDNNHHQDTDQSVNSAYPTTIRY